MQAKIFIAGLVLASTTTWAEPTITAAANEASFATEFSKCIKDGHFKGKMRVRNEFRSNQGKAKDADAFTTSGTVGYVMKCGKATVFVEGQGNIGITNGYNTTLNGQTQRPTIADRDSVELNQAYVDYDVANWLKVKAGRQEIKWGDESLIGAVGWRNLSTSFDAIRTFITPEFMQELQIEASYAGNFQNIKSQSVGMNSVFARMVYKGFKDQQLSGHVILLDFDEGSGLSKTSTKTYGVAYSLEKKVSDSIIRDSKVKLDLAGDLQQAYGNNPTEGEVYRTLARATFTVKKVSLFIGNERLTSTDGKAAFARPLATLHAVNGWSDQFLITPKKGLNDFHVGAIVQDLIMNKSATKISAHTFQTDEDSTHIGDELDLQYSLPVEFIAPGAQFLTKVALYNGDKNSPIAPKDDVMVTGQLEVPFNK
jgi:hypothetical protein